MRIKLSVTCIILLILLMFNQTGGNEVLVSGLNIGDSVVTAGVHKLREGQTVRTE